MRVAFLTVLLCITQAAPQVARQEADSASQTSQKAQKGTAQRRQPAAPTLSSKDVIGKAGSEKTAASNPASQNTEQAIRVRELTPVSVSRDWMDFTTLAFGAILVIVGIVGVCAAYRTLKAIERQAQSMRYQTTHLKNSVDAVINSERAWVIAELSPQAIQTGDGRWGRIEGKSLTAMTAEEIVRGKHYDHLLKLTNMGKTPAHILRFQVNYVRLPGSPENLPEEPPGELGEVCEADTMIPAGEAKEVAEPIINPRDHMSGSWTAIHDKQETGVVYGWVEYRHVFSGRNTPDCRTRFYYEYIPSLRRLSKIAAYSGEEQNQEVD